MLLLWHYWSSRLSLSLFYFFSLVPFSIWCLWVEDKAPILSSPKPQTGLDKIVSRIDGSQGFLFLELALSPSLTHTLCLLSLPICVYLRSYRSLCFFLKISYNVHPSLLLSHSITLSLLLLLSNSHSLTLFLLLILSLSHYLTLFLLLLSLSFKISCSIFTHHSLTLIKLQKDQF